LHHKRPGQTPDNLGEALRKLESANEITVHGFCAELLRERPIGTQLDALFTVLTEPRSKKLFIGVFDLWLQEQLADPPEGVRRIFRRRAWPGDEEGSTDGLRRARYELTEWRDVDGQWTRPGFHRERRIDETFNQSRTCRCCGNGVPRQPVTNVQPMKQYVSNALARPRLYAVLLGAFASLALLLAAVGLYGLMALQ